MKAMRVYMAGLLLILVAVPSVSAQEKAYKPVFEPVYWDVVDKIMEEAFGRSQVMENASWVCDVFGPRNSKSSGYIAAAEWAKERLEEYGLSNARLEPFEFGVGWENRYTSVHMMIPQYMPIIAYPAAWSAGTDGKIRASVMYINFEEIISEADLDKYRGKLRDLIIFIRPVQKITPHYDPMAMRFTDERLLS